MALKEHQLATASTERDFFSGIDSLYTQLCVEYTHMNKKVSLEEYQKMKVSLSEPSVKSLHTTTPCYVGRVKETIEKNGS